MAWLLGPTLCVGRFTFQVFLVRFLSLLRPLHVTLSLGEFVALVAEGRYPLRMDRAWNTLDDGRFGAHSHSGRGLSNTPSA
jgi:hypothetical protein